MQSNPPAARFPTLPVQITAGLATERSRSRRMCQPFLSQCGGNGWQGGTSCCGSMCYVQSEYRSQCRDDCPWDWECARSAQSQSSHTGERSWFTPSHEGKNPFSSDAMASAAADPNVQSLIVLLKLMGVLLLLACCSFARIRLAALRAKVQASCDPEQCDETVEMIDDAPQRPKRKGKVSKDVNRAAKFASGRPGRAVRR